MNRKAERQLHKKKERDDDIREEKKREATEEQAEAKGYRIPRPAWLYVVGAILLILIVWLWTFGWAFPW